jgi:hypothetical protein
LISLVLTPLFISQLDPNSERQIKKKKSLAKGHVIYLPRSKSSEKISLFTIHTTIYNLELWCFSVFNVLADDYLLINTAVINDQVLF